MKNTAKALHTVLKGTIEAPDCADTWHELAVYYRNVGQDQQAYMAVLTGLAHCLNSPSLHYMRGEYLVTAGKLKKPFSDFQQTASIKNDDGSPHIQLARISKFSESDGRRIKRIKKWLPV
ncbi:MAG: hypothetical protein IPP19_16485 [Verrucomicrobia bacterium]|nr:hypothetical protein [Verrucomicrobiota bacterium]